MNIQGNIMSIVPDGGYQGTNCYIYTFQMTIHTVDGTSHTGQIGSKSQTYPLAVGAPISVTVTPTQHGVRFKKYNPQYPPTAAPPQQTAPPPRQPQNTNRPTNGSKDRLIVTQVAWKGLLDKRGEVSENELAINTALMMKVGNNDYRYTPNPDEPNF